MISGVQLYTEARAHKNGRLEEERVTFSTPVNDELATVP